MTVSPNMMPARPFNAPKVAEKAPIVKGMAAHVKARCAQRDKCQGPGCRVTR